MAADAGGYGRSPEGCGVGNAGVKGCSSLIIREFSFICGVNRLSPRQGEDGSPIFGAGKRV